MAKKPEIVSWENLRRDVATLDQICLALVPKRQKRQSAAVLRYLIRSWNTRTTRYNGAVPGEWISRSVDQMLKANLANSRNPLNEYLQRLGPPKASANCVPDECADLIVRKRMKYGAKSKRVIPHFQLSRELVAILTAIGNIKKKMPEKTFKAFRDVICEPINDATPKEAYEYEGGYTYHLARIAFKHRACPYYNFDDFKEDISSLYAKADTFDPNAQLNTYSGHAAPSSIETDGIYAAENVENEKVEDPEIAEMKAQAATIHAKKEAQQKAKQHEWSMKYDQDYKKEYAEKQAQKQLAEKQKAEKQAPQK